MTFLCIAFIYQNQIGHEGNLRGIIDGVAYFVLVFADIILIGEKKKVTKGEHKMKLSLWICWMESSFVILYFWKVSTCRTIIFPTFG